VDGSVVWDGAWDYTSTMILKAAQSYVLRIAFGITGIVPVDELRDPADLAREGLAASLTADPEEAGYEFPTERLRAAVERANELEPMSWAPAKCEMVLGGRTDAELEEIAGKIEAENELRARRAERAPEPEPEPEPPDAEVVEPMTEQQMAQLSALRTRQQELRDRLAELDPSSTEDDAIRAAEELEAELAQVAERLREFGADE
jgi:hypothetical protein